MFVIEDDEPEAETEVVVQAMEKQPPSRASDDNDILDCGSGLPEPLPCQTSVSAAKSGHQHVNGNGAPGSNKRKHPQPAERASGKPERVKRRGQASSCGGASGKRVAVHVPPPPMRLASAVDTEVRQLFQAEGWARVTSCKHVVLTEGI